MRVRGLLLTILLLATACTGNPAQTSSSAPSESSGEVSLESKRIELGLPECPETDPEAEQVTGGLPVTDLPCLGTGQRVNLAGLPRKPMVVNFWAQWCPPCRAEAPILRDAHERHDDVSFIGVNFNDPQPELALEFAGEAEWSYPHLMDQDKTLQRGIGVPGLPMTLFVDAEGVVQYRHAGEITSDEQLEAFIEEYL